MKSMDEVDEYLGLNDLDQIQFRDAFNSGDPERCSDPKIKNLVIRAIKREDKKMREIKGQSDIKIEDKKVETTELVEKKNGGMTLQETITLGDMIYKSRFYTELQNSAQAVAKILAGRELGFAPMVSLSKVYLVNGKVGIAAELMGDMIKRSSKYNYHVLELTNEKCSIKFFENGKEIGISNFSLEDARRAGLSEKEVYKKYPRNLVFSRALSNGCRWYCPDAIHGAYTPEELGQDIVIDTLPVGKPEIVIEPEVMPTKKSEATRAELIEELKIKYGKDHLKKIKDKLKIEGKLANISYEEFEKYRKELAK